jgi:hypothetical protein
MRKYFLAGASLSLLISFAPAAAQQTCPPPQSAVSPVMQCGARGGTDLLAIPNVTHPNACKFLCDGNNHCRAWTYMFADRSCRLKAQVPPAAVQNNNCCFTGRKI